MSVFLGSIGIGKVNTWRRFHDLLKIKGIKESDVYGDDDLFIDLFLNNSKYLLNRKSLKGMSWNAIFEATNENINDLIGFYKLDGDYISEEIIKKAKRK
jgi:hypothetical protein